MLDLKGVSHFASWICCLIHPYIGVVDADRFNPLRFLPAFWAQNFREHMMCQRSAELGVKNQNFLRIQVIYWLVVSTHLKNISQNQNGSVPQIEVKIKNKIETTI